MDLEQKFLMVQYSRAPKNVRKMLQICDKEGKLPDKWFLRELFEE